VIVPIANVYALATARNVERFAPVLSLVVGVEVEDGSIIGLVHEFALSEWLVEYLHRDSPGPVLRLAGQPVHSSLARATTALREQHREHLLEVGMFPTEPPDEDVDPITGTSRSDRNRPARQHAGVRERIEL